MQHVVAYAMPMVVVDRFKIVEVAEHQHARFTLARGIGQGAAKKFVKTAVWLIRFTHLIMLTKIQDCLEFTLELRQKKLMN